MNKFDYLTLVTILMFIVIISAIAATSSHYQLIDTIQLELAKAGCVK